MTIDLDGLQLSSHEAAHVAAALSVGRRVFSVTREGHGPEAHGATHSEAHDKESVEEALVVLLAAPIIQPRGGNGDVRNAQWLCSFTPDPERTLADATDRVLELVRTDEFRRIHRTIERALWSRPTLFEEDITALLDDGRDRWLPSA